MGDESHESETDTVLIDPDGRGDRPVPETLFGRFAEHYGASEIEPSIHAEYLTNTAFVEWCRFQSEDELGDGGPGHYYAAETVGEDDGVPFPWYPVGDADRSRPETGGVRGYGEWTLDDDHWPVTAEEPGDACQRIDVDGATGGVGQRVLLPDWRTLGYEAALSLRTPPGADPVDAVTIRLNSPDGETLASATVEDIPGSEWERFDAVPLELADQSGEKYEVTSDFVHAEESPYGVYDLEIVAAGSGTVDVDRASLLPDDAVEGPRTGTPFNPTTIELMADRSTTLLKWPGGNYTSTYNWERGVGPIEDRPVWPNVIWNGIDPNLTGTAEYVDFCELTGVEATITVGVTVPPEDGGREFQPPDPITPEEAANWVEYCNGDPAETEYGALRAEHGYEEPFDVSVWEVGNEVWGPWQAGGSDDPEPFAEVAAEFAEAMRAADDSITIYSDGIDPMYGDDDLPDAVEWNRTIFEIAGDALDGIGMHRYNWGIRDPDDIDDWMERNDADGIDYSEVLVSFPTQFGDLLAETAELAAQEGFEDVDIVVGEWGLYPMAREGVPWPVMETTAGATYVAGMFNAFIRHSDVMSRGCHTHFPTRMIPPVTNPIKPVGYTLKLYADVFTDGRTWEVLDTTTDGKTRDIPETGDRIRPMDDVPYVDAVSVATPETDAMSAFLTNRNLRSGTDVTVEVPAALDGQTATVTVQRPTGDPHDLMRSIGDYPESWFEWTGMDVYGIDERTVPVEDGSVTVSLGPSATARVLIE